MRATGSAMQRVMSCPGFMKLDRVNSTNAGAQKGTRLHDWFYDHGTKGLEPETEQQIGIAAKLEQLKGAFPDAEWLYEPALQYLDGEGKLLGENISRNYPPPEGMIDICGSADIIGLDKDTIILIDLKQGRTFVEAPDNNWQLKTLAMIAGKLWPNRMVVAEIWKADENGDVDLYQGTYTTNDLLDFENQIIQVWGGSGEVVMGVHCEWCPAIADCPAQKAAVNALTVPGDAPIQISADNVAMVFHRYKLVERAAEITKKALTEFIRVNGPVLDGIEHELCMKPRNSRFVTTSGAKYLQETLPKSMIDEVCPRKVTLTALSKALPKKEYQALVQKLDDYGHIKVHTAHSLGIRKLKRGRQ